MDPEQKRKSLAFAIIEYLQEQRNGPTLSEGSSESLEGLSVPSISCYIKPLNGTHSRLVWKAKKPCINCLLRPLSFFSLLNLSPLSFSLFLSLSLLRIHHFPVCIPLANLFSCDSMHWRLLWCGSIRSPTKSHLLHETCGIRKCL